MNAATEASAAKDDVAPLAHVENVVQNRAKELALDLKQPRDRLTLRDLIHESIAQWQLDYDMGKRVVPIADAALVAERAMRNIAGYGPLEPLLRNDDVYEIMINGPTSIFVKRHSGPGGFHNEVFHDDAHVTRTITKILNDSGGAHRKLDPTEGLQDAQLESGARMHIVHGDVGRDGHMLINIRKFTGIAITTLDELVRREMLDHASAAFLRACVRSRSTIVFAGAPGSGKTTMLSCCAGELDPSLRVAIAEEVFEADIPLSNVASMQTRPARADRPAVDLRRLVSGFLRMAPDVAIVGEVRDRESLPFLLTLSSGIKGFTTIHAGSARQALTRLRFIAQLADVSNELPLSALNSLISESVDLIVHCERTPVGVRVNEIIAVEDQQSGSESTAFTTTEVFRRIDPAGPLLWTGLTPGRLTKILSAAGYTVQALLGAAHQATGGPA